MTVQEKKSPGKKAQKPINIDEIVVDTIELLLKTAQDSRKVSDITATDIDDCLLSYLTKKKQISKVYRKK